jgi:hypothetical protein
MPGFQTIFSITMCSFGFDSVASVTKFTCFLVMVELQTLVAMEKSNIPTTFCTTLPYRIYNIKAHFHHVKETHTQVAFMPFNTPPILLRP